MKKTLSILSLAVLSLLGCKDKQPTTAKEETAATKPAIVEADPATDSADIRKTITDFYNWYAKEENFKKFQAYDLYVSIKKKNMPPYKIDWDAVEKYQQFIRSSVPQLGEEFLRNQTYFFRQCDSAFKKDLQDELPYGFDYDWYTNSQDDAMYLVDEINKNKPWPISISRISLRLIKWYRSACITGAFS